MSSPAVTKKVVPKVAIIGLEKATAETLRTTFQQFKIDSHVVSGNAVEAMQKKKYEGCVVHLDDKAMPVLEAVRNSPRNRQITILGICENTHDAIRFSKFGINAVLKQPLERQDAVKAVRSTHLLILHELRRYVRLPIVLEVLIEVAGGNKVKGMTRDISYGGMSVTVPTKISAETTADLKFTLPSGDVVKIPASVLWFHPPELVGLKFESTDEPRQMVRRWIDAFLEIA
jgi:PilZ domain-containing protein